MSTSKAIFDPLRVRLLRILFTGGLGFVALVLGSMLSATLYLRFAVRVDSLPFAFLRLLLHVVRGNLWVLLVLPLLCYGASRIVELRPWSTAVGAALSSRLFLLTVEFVSAGVDGWVERGWVVALVEWSVFAVGVVLCQRAVLKGRADASSQAEQTQAQASTKQDEYAEFLREAERAGEKIAQREASSNAEPGAVHPQPAPEQAPPAPEQAEQKPEDSSKAPAA
ncbi:hypothetical protein [Archangium sp.]|uniref:hypothetical protein n=1 Tax=Archangium sp. TaxID=1872627 RepID=UPI00286C70FC|nr:hypothetical protein [Archangium sp.]